MTWPGPHDFADGPGNTASGVEVMENLEYLLTQIQSAAVPGGPGTSLPGTPDDGEEYLYIADGTNGVVWHLKYHGGSSKWRCIGGPPLFAETTAFVTTTSTSYAALSGSAGPVIVVPKSGVYIVTIGMAVSTVDASIDCPHMSYDIGGTGAVDADSIVNAAEMAPVSRARSKSLGAVTLTAKYKVNVSDDQPSPSVKFGQRWMQVQPVTIG